MAAIEEYMKHRRYRVLVLAVFLFVASIAMLLVAGYSLGRSLLWNSLSVLEVPYDIVQVSSANSPFIIAADMMDTFIFALLTFFAAQWFAIKIKNINPQAKISSTKIGFTRGHVIIAPFNRFGRSVAWELEHKGAKYVVVGAKGEFKDYAKRNKLLSIPGDTGLPDTYIAAGIKRAKYVVACSEDDMENAMIAITVKSINSGVKVFSRVTNLESIPKIHRAGANRMILPEVSAGTAAGNEIVNYLRGSAGAAPAAVQQGGP